MFYLIVWHSRAEYEVFLQEFWYNNVYITKLSKSQQILRSFWRLHEQITWKNYPITHMAVSLLPQIV
jgi:hypothetical protein